jgi:hypothetical protein
LDRRVKVQTEGKSILHNEELHTLYCLSDVVTMIRLRGMECGYVIKHERNENCRENITIKSDRKRQLAKVQHGWEDYNKMGPTETVYRLI